MSFFETEKIYHFFYTCFRLIKSRVMLLRTYFAIITYLSVIAITGNFELDKFIMLVFCVYLGSLGTYLLNDISDYSADSHNRKVTSFTFDVNYQRFIFYFALSCGLISIILALLINFKANLIIMIVATALAFLYSLPPIQLKKYFITKTIVSAVGSLLTSLLGATAAGYYPEILIPLLILSFLSAWTLSTLADVHDMEGDFKAGRRTIPIVMGFHHTLFLIYFFIILSTLIAVGGIILFAQANIIGISIAVAAGGYMLYRTIRISYDPSLKTYMKNPVNDLVQVLLQLSLLISILIRS